MFELDPIYSNECSRSSSWVENNESRIIEESSFKQACNGTERGRNGIQRRCWQTAAESKPKVTLVQCDSGEWK